MGFVTFLFSGGFWFVLVLWFCLGFNVVFVCLGGVLFAGFFGVLFGFWFFFFLHVAAF